MLKFKYFIKLNFSTKIRIFYRVEFWRENSNSRSTSILEQKLKNCLKLNIKHPIQLIFGIKIQIFYRVEFGAKIQKADKV